MSCRGGDKAGKLCVCYSQFTVVVNCWLRRNLRGEASVNLQSRMVDYQN